MCTEENSEQYPYASLLISVKICAYLHNRIARKYKNQINEKQIKLSIRIIRNILHYKESNSHTQILHKNSPLLLHTHI